MSADSQESTEAFILRTLDGADRPLLVEQVYARWSANVANISAPNLRRDQILNEWPDPGLAWKTFQDPIEQLIAAGSVVMCTNTDPADHPERHLTQGHQNAIRFVYGSMPMVLRYLATPQGSLAWRETIARQDQLAQQEAELEQKRRVALGDAVCSFAALRPVTAVRVALKYSCKRREAQRILLELNKAGRLKPVGTTIWGALRWQAVPAPEQNEQQDVS